MKWKRLAVIGILLVLLIPVRFELDDGGSMEWRSMVYAVKKYHQLAGEGEYLVGWGIEIFGWEMICAVERG